MKKLITIILAFSLANVYSQKNTESTTIDSKYNIETKEVKSYNDSTNEVVIKWVDKDGNFKPNSDGVYIHYILFDSIFEDKIVQECFYDNNNNLIDNNYIHRESLNSNLWNNVQCNYSKLISKYSTTGNLIETKYYNSNGEIVCI